MSLEHRSARQGRTQRGPSIASDPSFTVKEFCAAERMSRGQLYKAWAEGWGPTFYWNGNSRRITAQARLNWQAEREAAAGKRPWPEG